MQCLERGLRTRGGALCSDLANHRIQVDLNKEAPNKVWGYNLCSRHPRGASIPMQGSSASVNNRMPEIRAARMPMVPGGRAFKDCQFMRREYTVELLPTSRGNCLL